MSNLLDMLSDNGIVPINVTIARNNPTTHKHFMRSYRPHEITADLIKECVETTDDVTVNIQLRPVD